MMAELQIAGVSAVVIITLLVQMAKNHGLDSRWASLVAVGLGVLFAALVHVSSASIVFATWLDVIVSGLMTGFASAGLYSGQKAIRNQHNGD